MHPLLTPYRWIGRPCLADRILASALAPQINWLSIALVFFAVILLADDTRADTQQPVTSEPVERLHQIGKIRVFFHTEGKHAISPVDLNHNGVPDQAEDTATQAQAAYLLFVDALGFPDPFKTERFRNAAFLDIRFRHKDVLRTNGAAYDELQRFNRAGDPPNTRSLCFDVATSINASSNLTPTHEFFHIIQNSVSYFKNSWYTEGTARWSERALGIGGVGPVREKVSLPLPDDKRETLFGMRYEASEYFWNALAVMDDSEGIIPESMLSAELKQMTYANGAKVMQDFRFTGWQFIREVLRELDNADDIAFRELGYDRWSEANQKSAKNNSFILHAVMEAVRTRKNPSP